MRRRQAAILVGLCLVVAEDAAARGGTARLAGTLACDLPLRSTGTAQSGGAWALDANGYVGGYIRVDRAGPVTVTVTASAIADGAPARMRIAVADAARAFDVGPAPAEPTAKAKEAK